jgi:BTB/POZ domain
MLNMYNQPKLYNKLGVFMSLDPRIKNMITRIAQSDLENDYIIPGNSAENPLTLVTPGKVGTLLGRTFDLHENTDARFIEALHILSSLGEEKEWGHDPKFVSDIFTVCDKLRHRINKIEDGFQCKNAYVKVRDLLVKTALTYFFSDQPDAEVFQKFSEAWKENLQMEFYRGPGDLIISQKDTLHIRKPNPESVTQIAVEIQKILEDHPEIRYLQFQGLPPISREKLDISKFYTFICCPPVCIFEGFEEIPVNPALVLQSDCLTKMLINSGMKEKQERRFSLPQISYEIFAHINQHASDWDFLEISETNIQQLTEAADFLDISQLRNRCDAFLSEHVSEELKNLKDDTLAETAGTWLEMSRTYRLPHLQDQCEKALNDWLCVNSHKELPLRLQKLAENRIFLENLKPRGFAENELVELLSSDQFSRIKSLTLSGKYLTLSNNFATEIGPHLAQLQQLQSLNLTNCNQLTDAIGPHLAQLQQLQSLNLTNCNQLTDAIGPYLAQLQQLQSLNLYYCNQLTDAIGPYLAQLLHLQSLNLYGCNKLTDAIGPYIAQLLQLQSLNLYGYNKLTDAIGPHLAQLQQLQKLKLSDCNQLTDAIGPHLAKLQQLQSLDLDHCNQLTDAIGPHLAKLQQLQSLDLDHCNKLTDAIGPYIAQLLQLQSLNLYDCNKLTDAIGPYIAQLLQLQSLNLYDCNKLTDAIGPYLTQIRKVFR